MFCPHCGKQLIDGSRFCQFCGNSLSGPNAPTPPQKPAPASIPFDPQLDLYPEQPPAAPAPMPFDANVYSDSVSPKPKKKGKTAVLIVAIVLVLALLIGGGVGFFLYTRHVYEENMAAYNAAETLLKKGDYDGALKGFRKLDDFEDAQDRVEELEELQDAYDEALELLDEGNYSDAHDAFDDLGDYRDSETMLDSEIPYRQACDTMKEAAGSASAEFAFDHYFSAAEQFAALGDYADAADKASECFLQGALAMLDLGIYDQALSYLDRMNAEDSAQLQEAYASLYADGAFLMDLKEAMLVWYDKNDNYTRSEELILAWDMMAPYESASFIDPALADRLADFQYALDLMYSALEDENTVGVWSTYYLGEFFLFDLADQMYYNYGMFADDPENLDRFVGVSESFYAYSQLEYSFECWWDNSATADLMDDGNYYATYTNDTEYSFTLYATIYFYDGYGDLLEVSDEMAIYVARGATVYIPTIPKTVSNDDWSTWSIFWDFGDVS